MTALTQNFVRRLFRLPEIATDSVINQITTDSRTAQRGDLFAACAQAYTRGDGTQDADVSGDQEQL